MSTEKATATGAATQDRPRHLNPIPAVDPNLASEAAAASDLERQLGLWKSLKLYPKAAAWSVLLSTALIMEGFDIVLLGNLYALPTFQQKFGEKVPSSSGGYQITAAWQSGLSNGALVGELLGLTINGWLADRFGYRYTIIGALSMVVCFVFITFFAQSLTQLLIGEILLGIPWGVFQTITTTYASEVCPTHLRAYLTTYVNLCWVLGQFIASGVLRGTVGLQNQWGYRIPFALQWIWPIPLIVGVWFAPESPWWLVRKGRLDDAKHSLARLTSRNSEIPFNPDETIALMRQTNEMEYLATEGTGYKDLMSNAVSRRRTEIVCVVWAIQNLCGSSLMGFSTYFFEQAGMATSNSFSMSLGLYAIGAVGTVSSWFLIGRFGRRTLYLWGQIGLMLVLLGIGFASLAGANNAPASWAIGSLVLVYTLMYDSTVGPVCYSLVAELPSTRLKTKSVVVARNVYNIAGLVCNIIQPRMLNPTAWNWGAKCGFFWAGMCFLCAVWTFFRLPEPRNRTYAELDVLFEHGVSARKFASTDVDSLVSRSVAGVGMEEKAGLEQMEDVAI